MSIHTKAAAAAAAANSVVAEPEESTHAAAADANDDDEVPASEPEAEPEAQDDGQATTADVVAETEAPAAAAAAAPASEDEQRPAKKAKKQIKKTAAAAAPVGRGSETRAAYEAKRHKSGQKLRFNELLRKCISKGAVKDLGLRSGMLTTMKETKEFIRRLYASLTTTLMVAALYHTTGAKRCIISLEDIRRAYQSQTGWALYAHDMSSRADFAKCRLLSQKTLNARAAAKRLQKSLGARAAADKGAAAAATATAPQQE